MSFRRTLRHVPGMIALAPAAMVVLVVYLGCTIWAIGISMTASRILPGGRFVGLEQYAALFGNERWQVSIGNLAIFGVLFVVAAIVLGFSLAILLDQKIRGEDFFRSIYLYPYSMSFVVTGLVWQWMLTPGSGIEKMVRDFGFAGFRFDWIVDQSMVVYTLVLAAVWQASGVVMAIALAGLRGIDEEIWKAVRIDGIPAWRAYISIILPMMRGAIGTCVVLLVDLGGAALRSGRRDDQGRPRHRLRSARQIRDGLSVHPPEYRARDRRHDRHADDRAGRARSLRLPAIPAHATGGHAMSPQVTTRSAFPDAITGRPAAPAARSRGRMTPARIAVYAVLIVAALIVLLPLYVMLITSFKTMDEIREGAFLGFPQAPTFEPWIKAWTSACTGLQLRRHPRRLLQLGADSRAQCHRLDRGRLDQRLCARLLAGAGRPGAVRHPARRRLHPLPDLHLSAGPPLLYARHLRLAARHRARSTRFSACRS